MICIFCDNEFTESSIEHIVPESLGNLKYILPPNIICNNCNNRFSAFEEKAITKSILSLNRIQNAIKTKKGNPSTLNIGSTKAVGHPEFKKNQLTFTSLENKDVKNFNPLTGSYEVTIPDFDNTEMSASKMILKIGFESIFKSNNLLFNKCDFKELKLHLTNKNNNDWPFITSHNQQYEFKSIPRYNDKYHLAIIKCKLSFIEISETILLFDFQYDDFNLTINLLGRDFSWSRPYFINDTSTSLYPKHLKKPS